MLVRRGKFGNETQRREGDHTATEAGAGGMCQHAHDHQELGRTHPSTRHAPGDQVQRMETPDPCAPGAVKATKTAFRFLSAGFPSLSEAGAPLRQVC